MSTLIYGPKSKTMLNGHLAKYIEPHGIDPRSVVSIEIRQNPSHDYTVTYIDKNENLCILEVKTSLWVSND